MSKISIDDFAKNLRQNLTIYEKEVNNVVNSNGLKSIKKLVKLTKATAPVGKRKGRYKRNITYSERFVKRGLKKYTWHVKSPDYRLTHLLANGHVTRNGGRSKANPFLKNAVDTVISEYERNIEEALKGDK